ncbi:MAG: hypothetical protein IPJ65_36095 [Archangiaceae bacterium]|nr:hypothetical protein [Archangiaceae bacterium]
MLSVYCDGSSTDRGGRAGGWAFVVVRDGVELTAGSGGAKATTNNLMELAAARAGLEAATKLKLADEEVELVTDSRYVLEQLGGGVRGRWVRGHSGEQFNERADALAHQAKQAFIPAKVKRRLERRRR